MASKRRAKPAEVVEELGAPSVAEVEELKKALQSDPNWVKQKGKDKKWRELYYGEHDIPMPARTGDMVLNPEKYLIRENLARDFVDRMTGLKLIAPTYSVAAAGIGRVNTARAEDVEEFLNISGPQIEYQQGEDTNFLVTSEADLFGYSALEVLPDPTLLSDWPKRAAGIGATEYLKNVKEYEEDAPIPIVEWHLPAESWWPLLDGRKVLKSLVIQKVPAAVLKTRYGYDITGSGKKATDIVEIVRFTDKTFVNVYCNDVTSDGPIAFFRHKMPCHDGAAPVVLYEGMLAPDTRPGYHYVSQLEGPYSLFTARDMMLSRELYMIAFLYLPTIIEEMEASGALDVTAGAQRDPDFLLGAANTMPPGRKAKWMEAPGLLQYGETLWGKARESVDRVIPKVLMGQMDGESGYRANQAADWALVQHKPVMDRLARSDGERARLRLEAIPAVSEILKMPDYRVCVVKESDKGARTIGLRPSDVDGIGPRLRSKRDRVLPVDKLANLQAAQTAYEYGFSWVTATEEYIGTPDPGRERIRRRAEDMENTGVLAAKRDEEVLRELQLLKDEEDGMDMGEAAGLAGEMSPGLAGALGFANVVPPEPEVIPPPLPVNAEPSDVPPPEGRRGYRKGPPRKNARAGQRTQPGGPHKRASNQGPQGSAG